MSKYFSLAHSKFLIRYHLIFSTKYRRGCLAEIRGPLLEAMVSAQTPDFVIETQEVDRDHIHILVRATPNVSPSEIAGRLKQFSTVAVWRDCPQLMRRWYWGRRHLLWTRGYFCASIGEVSKATIERYIREQG